MAAPHKIFLGLFLFFGIVGIGLHLVGFVLPGWIEMRRSVEDIRPLWMSLTEISEEERITEGILIRKDDKAMLVTAEEDIVYHKFMETIMLEVSFEEISYHYGLWYTKICAHGSKPKEEEVVDEDGAVMVERSPMDSSSSEEHHRRKHGRRCHCKKFSTKCALKFAGSHVERDSRNHHELSPSNMGHGSLTEHQIETTIGLALMVIGLVGGILTFRKADGCRCVKVATILIMLTAVVLVSVPVMRMVHYSHYRNTIDDGVKVKCPHSAIMSGAGCVMILICSLITLCGLISQKRKERAGQWYRFNNEFAEEKSKKGPALVFYNDPYPVKAGLTDVCDFGDVKPVETASELEKKPVE